MGERTIRHPANANYAARRKESGVTRINVVLDEPTLAAVGRIMRRLNCSRQDAVRSAILLADERPTPSKDKTNG